MAFKSFGSFLSRFSALLLTSPELNKKIFQTLKEFFPKSNFSLRLEGRVLIISAPPSLQSEIFINQEKILLKLREALGPRAPSGISFRPL